MCLLTFLEVSPSVVGAGLCRGSKHHSDPAGVSWSSHQCSSEPFAVFYTCRVPLNLSIMSWRDGWKGTPVCLRSWAGGDGHYSGMAASRCGKWGLSEGSPFQWPGVNIFIQVKCTRKPAVGPIAPTGQWIGNLCSIRTWGSLPCFVLLASWPVVEFLHLGFHSCQIVSRDAEMQDAATRYPTDCQHAAEHIHREQGCWLWVWCCSKW